VNTFRNAGTVNKTDPGTIFRKISPQPRSERQLRSQLGVGCAQATFHFARGNS